MLTFNYTATINALPIGGEKQFLETLTGDLLASDHTQAKKQASRLAFDRCRQLEQEQGGIIGYENVYVTCRTGTVQEARSASSVMTPEKYKQCALRTLYRDLSFKDRLGLCGIGLPSELGEALDYIKKFLYHRNGMPLAVDQIKDELGDMLWYFFILLDTLGLTFEEVMLANAQKLEERHPNGFKPHYVSDSHASEVKP